MEILAARAVRAHNISIPEVVNWKCPMSLQRPLALAASLPVCMEANATVRIQHISPSLATQVGQTVFNDCGCVRVSK